MPDMCGEIEFWSGIMRDHADFILGALPQKEAETADRASEFKDYFKAVNSEAIRGNCGMGQEGNDRLTETLLDFIGFKQSILTRLLTCDIDFNLPPTFVNHMINEALEFKKTLEGEHAADPALELAFLHNIWLTDAAGHSDTIAADLDPAEELLRKEAMMFTADFKDLRNRSLELRLMLQRTGLGNGILNRFNNDVVKVMTDFIGYLEKIKDLLTKCAVLSILKPLIPDHMIREERYYLSKIRDLSSQMS